MAVEISDTNYNGLSCSVTLYAATGNTIPYTNATQIPLGTKTIPFTYSSSTVSNEYGTFSCFYSFLNKTCTSSLLTPPDGDGNRYKTIKIGEQVWMSENLKTKKFNDGTPLDNPGNTDVDLTTWAAANGTIDSSTTKYWALVNDNSANTAIYGLVYNHFAVYYNYINICPSGWRVPSESDFSTLNTYLGANAGTQAKSTTLWSSGNGTNTSGFNGLPSGSRTTAGGWGNFGTLGIFWSTSTNVSGARYIILYNSQSNIAFFSADQKNGYSVRCIQN